MQTDLILPRHRAIARSKVDQLNRLLIASAAERRQGTERGRGDRAAAGLAQPRRALKTVTEARVTEAGVVQAPVTPLGYKTAVRAMPLVLAGLEPGDRRLRVAMMLADACERIGAVKGGDLEGGNTKGGVSDGGVTTKIKHVERFNLIERLANGWRVHPKTGAVERGPELIAMRVQRQRGNAQHIKAMPLLIAVCVEGQSMRAILEAHGWTAHAKHRKTLAAAVLAILDEIASGGERLAKRA